MNKNEKAILWLDIFEFLTTNKKQKIISLLDEPKDLFDCFNEIKHLLRDVVTSEQMFEMERMLNIQVVENYIQLLTKNNVGILTCYSENYPQQFLDYENYPLVLYYKGDISLINTPCVGVVGTRRITRYGERVTELYCQQLSASGVTIVSGMAEGVDTIAAKTALKNGGKTIAVLGSGFNDIYPHSNLELSKQIAQKGLLITEYSPTTKAATYHFPVRNRIIVGLSDAVLITEAGIKSGVMYTKDYCLEYGKDMFIVPGNIDSKFSEGTNAIIKSMQGAITTSPNDILDALKLKNNFKEPPKHQISIEEQLIVDCIGSDEVHFDEIQMQTKLDTKILLRLLTSLELNGIIKKLAGNYYCK